MSPMQLSPGERTTPGLRSWSARRGTAPAGACLSRSN